MSSIDSTSTQLRLTPIFFLTLNTTNLQYLDDEDDRQQLQLNGRFFQVNLGQPVTLQVLLLHFFQNRTYMDY